jgi:hypothetical protein
VCLVGNVLRSGYQIPNLKCVLSVTNGVLHYLNISLVFDMKEDRPWDSQALNLLYALGIFTSHLLIHFNIIFSVVFDTVCFKA